MKKIAVLTATRAEYGLLVPVIRCLRQYENTKLKIDLIVTGTHLSVRYGHTIDEIKKQGMRIDYEVPISVEADAESSISENQADILRKFSKLFEGQKYEAVVILGDRYEMLAIAIAAANLRMPIFHLCGGDTTEGAMDEWIRHSITKMSYLHFVTNVNSYRRVVQLGESPDRIYNYGSTSIDNINNAVLMNKEEALASVGLKECQYAICTYHPVTLSDTGIEEEVRNLIQIIKNYPDIEFIVTKSNADFGGQYINAILEHAEQNIENLHLFSSLGMERYLSLLKYAMFEIGNSSSGIIEAPALHTPTINIGERQRGRLQADSIINCHSDIPSITAAIEKAISREFQILCKKVCSPYGDGHAAEKIAEKIVETVLNEKIDLKKTFYDIDIGDDI